MALIAIVLLAALAVPLAGGRLMKLAELRFRSVWLLGVGLAIQILVFTLFPGPPTAIREASYVASYLVGVWFVLSNRRLSGLWLIGVGAGLNLIAILANKGVMPAAPTALASAGLPISPTRFVNSLAVPAPRLLFLGDIFAIPQSWPLHNVFSLGDVGIAIGAIVAIHRATGSRLIPSGQGQFLPLFRRASFVRVWSAQAVSNLGDWMYALAVAAVLAERTKSAESIALLLVAQSASAAVFGLLLGPLADRYSRRMLMIGADAARAMAVLSLLVGGQPTPLRLYLVAGSLGLFGAVFQPSLQASVPNLVREDQVVPANSLISSTFHFAIVAGPALGGLLVARLGARPVFAVNGVSFAISALLLAGIELPRPVPKRDRSRAAAELAEGIRYALITPLVRGVIVVTGLVMLGAATKAPLESLFVLGTLSLGPQALGLLGGCWGTGMLLGAFSAPALARRWTRERLLLTSIALVGFAVLAASRAHELSTVLLAWLLAGMANAVGNVSYSSLLQERTPDRMRGRIFAASETVLDAAYLAGALLAGWAGVHLGIRSTYVLSGALMLLAASICAALLPPDPSPAVRRHTLERVLERSLTDQELHALGISS